MVYLNLQIQAIAEGLKALGWNTAGLPAASQVQYAATAPTSPANGQFWLDTTTSTLKIYSNGSWQSVALSVSEYNVVHDLVTNGSYNKAQVDNNLLLKQDKLLSGTNIKTINSQSIVGDGDLVVTAAIGPINDLTDVDVVSPTSGQTLTYDGTKWVNQSVASAASITIAAPSILTPTSGAIDFVGAITSSPIDMGSNIAGVHDTTIWELSYTPDFTVIILTSTVGNLTSWSPITTTPSQICYVRCRYGSGSILSGWSNYVSFTTSNIYVKTPIVYVTGAPMSVPSSPNITTSTFVTVNGVGNSYLSSDIEIIKTSDNTVVYSVNSTNAVLGATSISVPSGILLAGTQYRFRVRHISDSAGTSSWGETTATVATSTLSIGVAGTMNFGVGPSTENFSALGLSEMAGTNTAGHDEYGNYQHTNGSIMVHVPKFYYRIGDVSSPRYAQYGVNCIDIVGTETFDTEAAANAGGYALHRAFIDGGAEKGGFFIDKYLCSSDVNDTAIALSVKNGKAISLAQNTDATYSPSSQIAGCTGILADSVILSRARGYGFNTASAFMYGALSILSLAHGQSATGTAACGWYDPALVTNFPKGNTGSNLKDASDSSVIWTPAVGMYGKTGSAVPFNKSTHNGQNNGIADLSGIKTEVGIGITRAGSTISAYNGSIDPIQQLYTLKKSKALKDMTAGWADLTSLWGASNTLPASYDSSIPPITLVQSSVQDKAFGNVFEQVLDGALSGDGHTFCGIFPKNDTGMSTNGTNMFGVDLIRYCPLENTVINFGGHSAAGIAGGIFYRHMHNYRNTTDLNISFRVCAYA